MRKLDLIIKYKKIVYLSIALIIILFISYRLHSFLKNNVMNPLNSLSNSLNNLSEINKKFDKLIQNSVPVESKELNDTLSSVNLDLRINGYEQEVNMKYSDIEVKAKTLKVEGQNIIELNVPNDATVKINGQTSTGRSEIKLDNLNKSTSIMIEIEKNNGDYRKILIPTLPDSFPNIEIGGYSKVNLTGDYYGNTLNVGDSYVYKMGIDGKIKYYYNSNKKTGAVMNFKKEILNDEVFYSFFEPVDDYNKITIDGIQLGEIVLLNQNFEEVKRIRLKETDKLHQGGYTENHDYIFIDENHYVLLASTLVPIKQTDGSFKQMRGTYIQEVKNDKVVFEWNSGDYDTLSSSYDDLGDQGRDYMHTNSIIIDEKDNNFIISSRHQNSVMKIDRKNGNIIWTLGGKNDDFNLNEDQLMSKQHYAYLDFNNNILLFDNGNSKKKTSIKVFNLDEEKKVVLDYDKYEFGNQFSPACGSVQQISEDLYLIGWGYTNGDVIATLYNYKTKEIVNEFVSNVSLTYRFQYFE